MKTNIIVSHTLFIGDEREVVWDFCKKVDINIILFDGHIYAPINFLRLEGKRDQKLILYTAWYMSHHEWGHQNPRSREEDDSAILYVSSAKYTEDKRLSVYRTADEEDVHFDHIVKAYLEDSEWELSSYEVVRT